MVQEMKCAQHLLTILILQTRVIIQEQPSTSAVTNLGVQQINRKYLYYPSFVKLSYMRCVQRVPEVRAWSSSASITLHVV